MVTLFLVLNDKILNVAVVIWFGIVQFLLKYIFLHHTPIEKTKNCAQSNYLSKFYQRSWTAARDIYKSWKKIRTNRKGGASIVALCVSPTESSWMLRPLNKASLAYYAPDRWVPTLDRATHGSHKAGSTAAVRLPIGYRLNWPDLT